MSSASTVLTPWMTHWLLEPETAAANGEVKKSDVSSIFLCRVLSCFGEVFEVWAAPPSSSCWWVEAALVWSTTKTMNEATTIRQMIQEARRSSAASEEDAPEDPTRLD